MKIFTPHQILLMQRERRAVMGHRAVSLWMLSAVLVATFLSIAFSAGSMAYLDEKMNDPFTFWLNVSRKSNINLRDVADELMSDSMPQRYHYDGVQTTISTSIDMFSKQGKSDLFHLQHYENMGSDLVHKVLNEENVVTSRGLSVAINPDSIVPGSLGVIMTADAMQRLGYSEAQFPAYVNLRIPASGADTLGYWMPEKDYVCAPIPLLAVVRRLPMHKDVLASRYMSLQYNANDPFDMNKDKYVRNLYFFVPSGMSDFANIVKQCVPDSLADNPILIPAGENLQALLRTWRHGFIQKVCILGLPPISTVNNIEKSILVKSAERGVERVYRYDVDSPLTESDESEKLDDGLSIHFMQLDSIRAFQNFVTERWGKDLLIEMTQVNAKENFNSVSTMANILTVALIIFSIIAIVIFIVNMMQSYFQKVKRNLGTFKAFGISTWELIKVYMTIILGIVLMALVIALSLTWGVELSLQICGFTKDGGAPHLILWNYRTLFAILIILLSTIVSILFVMKQLLRKTPGDLIYDR